MGPKPTTSGKPPTPEQQGLVTPEKAAPNITPQAPKITPQAPKKITPKAPATPKSNDRSTSSRTNNKPKDNNRVTKPTKTRMLQPTRTRSRDPDLTAQLQAEDIQVFVSSDLEFEGAVASSNLLHRFARPQYVVQPQNTGQVQTIVQEAVARKLPLTIKNGGHSCIGSSFPKEGIMLDLKNMNKVTYDYEAREMTIQGGALWGHVYQYLVVEEEGLMVNGSRSPSVGVSGHVLGGGIGPFSRQYGMAVDCLNEITIVTADGEVYVLKPEDDPEKEEGQLFWALCGAGGGNFGVVVEIKIAVHKLTGNDGKNTQIVAGRHTWFPTVDRSRRGFFGLGEESSPWLATMNSFYTYDWPQRMTIDTSWLSDVQVHNGDIAIRFLTYFDGRQEEFDKLIKKGILNADLSKQLTRRALEEQSSRFLHESLAAQWDEETKMSTPVNSSFRIFHSFCFTNEPTQIAKITAIVKEELEAFKVLFAGEKVGLCEVTFIHAGGETTRPQRNATAFRWRDTIFHTYIMVQWADKWLEMDMRGFADKFKHRLRQFSIAGKAAFANFPDASIARNDHMKAYYGNNRDKLEQVKRLWDANNFFKRDQGINVARKHDQLTIDQAELNSKTTETQLSDREEDGPHELTDSQSSAHWEERYTAAPNPLLTLGYESLCMGKHLDGHNASG